MVFRNSDVTSKGNYGDTPSPGDDPFSEIMKNIADFKKELEDERVKIQALAKSMIGNPNKINVGYLMMLFSNVPDTNTALQAAQTVGVSNVIKEEWSKISSQMALFAHTEKYQPGKTIFYPEDVNNGKGVRLDGVAPDGNLMVTFLDDSGSPTGGSIEYNPSAPNGSLKPGVPFFDMSDDKSLSWSGDPTSGGLQVQGTPPEKVTLANNMIKASQKMHTITLQRMDDLKAYLISDKSLLGGVDTIISVLKDNVASFCMTDDPAYTFLASTGALGNLGKTDTSIIDGCSTVLSNINSSKNTVETTMNSTVSQSQVQLNQAQGQYQSCMTAIGGSLSSYKDMLSNFISNMRG
jgi:hypothetical protein